MYIPLILRGSPFTGRPCPHLASSRAASSSSPEVKPPPLRATHAVVPPSPPHSPVAIRCRAFAGEVQTAAQMDADARREIERRSLWTASKRKRAHPPVPPPPAGSASSSAVSASAASASAASVVIAASASATSVVIAASAASASSSAAASAASGGSAGPACGEGATLAGGGGGVGAPPSTTSLKPASPLGLSGGGGWAVGGAVGCGSWGAGGTGSRTDCTVWHALCGVAGMLGVTPDDHGVCEGEDAKLIAGARSSRSLPPRACLRHHPAPTCIVWQFLLRCPVVSASKSRPAAPAVEAPSMSPARYAPTRHATSLRVASTTQRPPRTAVQSPQDCRAAVEAHLGTRLALAESWLRFGRSLSSKITRAQVCDHRVTRALPPPPLKHLRLITSPIHRRALAGEQAGHRAAHREAGCRPGCKPGGRAPQCSCEAGSDKHHATFALPDAPNAA